MRDLKFYFDVHVPKAVATELRKRGMDVVRCQEIGLHDADDAIHLETATQQGRVVVSFDEDYPALHAAWLEAGKKHAGIMRLSPDLQQPYGIGQMVRVLADYHALISEGAGTLEADIENQLLFIS